MSNPIEETKPKARGGKRPGAGRPKGSSQKKVHLAATRGATRAAASAHRAVALLTKTGLDPFDGDAHAYLIWAYKNQDMPHEMRLDAARAALPYERPRLATQTIVEPIRTIDPSLLNVDELERVISAIDRRLEEDRVAEEIAQLVPPGTPAED